MHRNSRSQTVEGLKKPRSAGLGTGLLGIQLLSFKPFLSNDIDSCRLFLFHFTQQTLKHRLSSVMSVPLTAILHLRTVHCQNSYYLAVILVVFYNPASSNLVGLF